MEKYMKVAIVKESHEHESRVAVSPEIVKKIVNMGADVIVEKNAGLESSFLNEEYEKAGASIKSNFKETVNNANIILKVNPPSESEITDIPQGATLIGNLSVLSNKDKIKEYANANISALSIELIPRISRAQSMDILSSQSNLAGYKSVICAADEFGKSFPMMMTAAGTIPPARVLILGAGVAGLQAVATAKRLGAVVSAFDVRKAVKEQVESLGATFIEVKQDEDAETKGGYAKEMSKDYQKKQNEKIHQSLKKTDILITTALIPGKKAPTLVTKAMIEDMKPGSVIIDLAAIAGGNCELTEKNKTIISKNKVSVMGPTNILNKIAQDASRLYARNLWNFLEILLSKEGENININLNSKDEIIVETLITNQGKIIKKIS
jgi:NAD(P) transhydrogenase subunit alpha